MLYSQGDRVLVATWERSPSGRTRILFSSRGDELEIVSFLNRGTGWGEVGYRFPDGRRLDFVVSPGGEIVDGDPDALRAALDEPIGFLGLVHDFAGSDAARLRWTGAGTAVGVLPPYTSAEEGLPGWQRCTDQCAAGCPAQCAFECTLGLLDPLGLLCDTCKTSCAVGCAVGCGHSFQTRF